jgi:regulator of sigma E protease
MNVLFTIGTLIVVLGVLIFVHELGHFLAAKAAGIAVLRFSLGLGAPIRRLTWTKSGTEYSISWLPLGGYVKMASREEEVTSSTLEGGAVDVEVPPDRVFEAKPVWLRMIVILAGVTMNALFAWAAFSGLAYQGGRTIIPTTTVGLVLADSLPPGAEALRDLPVGARITAVGGRPVTSWNDVAEGLGSAARKEFTLEAHLPDGSVRSYPVRHTGSWDPGVLPQFVLPFRAPVIGQVLPGRPGERAGLAAGDTILAIDGTPISQSYDFLTVVRGKAGVPIALTVGRHGQRIEIRLTPEAETEAGPGGRKEVGKIGVALASDYYTESYTLAEAILAGGQKTLFWSTQIAGMVRGLLSGAVDTRALGGPILIGQMAAESARLGWDAFVGFMAVISVNLAVLNLLPIPVLDGGQFLFLLAEAIIRRPLSLKLRERLTLVGLVIILFLIVLAFSNDIRRLFGW